MTCNTREMPFGTTRLSSGLNPNRTYPTLRLGKVCRSKNRFSARGQSKKRCFSSSEGAPQKQEGSTAMPQSERRDPVGRTPWAIFQARSMTGRSKGKRWTSSQVSGQYKGPKSGRKWLTHLGVRLVMRNVR